MELFGAGAFDRFGPDVVALLTFDLRSFHLEREVGLFGARS
jgi:hypothetical protein